MPAGRNIQPRRPPPEKPSAPLRWAVERDWWERFLRAAVPFSTGRKRNCRESRHRDRRRKAHQVRRFERGAGTARCFRQVIHGWIIFQQEKSVQRTILAGGLRAIKVRISLAALVQPPDALARPFAQDSYGAELYRFGRARFGASRRHPVLLPVVA